ncbi:MAG: hypothetical protein IJY62_01340 [Clostridia bacterium]|nr:hypothetical protein [Clostridia bacterium]
MRLTKKKKAKIVAEVVREGERVTGREFVERLLNKAAEQPSFRESLPYYEVMREFIEIEERNQKECEALFPL